MESIWAQLEQAATPEEGMSPDDPGADAPGHTDYETPPEGGEMPPPEGAEDAPALLASPLIA